MAQYLALRAIAEDGVSGGALARRAGVSGPAVSQLVATLAAASWIEREPSATDRRLHVLSLSPSGRQLLRSVDRMLRAEVASLLAGVPAPEVDALARALPAVEALLSGHEPPRRPPPPGPPGRGPRPPRPSGRRR